MKIRKYKNGTIKMTAENKRDSNNLMAFLGGCAGADSNFTKIAGERNKVQKRSEAKEKN